MSVKSTAERRVMDATPDQLALLELMPSLIQTCRDHGGKLKVKRGDTAMKVTADSARLLYEDGWAEVVFDEEPPEEVTA